MYQVDRQWRQLVAIKATLEEQADDLRSLRRELRRRPAGESTAAGGGDRAIPEVFRHAREATRSGDFATGDWRIQPLAQNLGTLTPLIATDAYASRIQHYVFESLLVRDPDTLEWRGLLAEDWSQSDDGLTFTFTLREDLRFSDGEPLTADDVVFTYTFIMDEAIAAPRQRAYYQRVEDVVAEDDRTVTFHFEEPYFNALSLAGGLAIMPRHYYERFLDEPREFNESRSLLMGSGPYRLVGRGEWTPDRGRVELERNPRYWGPVEPPFRRLIWEVIENDSARLTTFRNGDIDLYEARPREFEQLLEDDELMARTTEHAYMSPTAGYSYLAWNQTDADGEPTRFADPRVRRALTRLTDREALVEEVMRGHAEVAMSPFNPRSPQHSPDLEPREADRERAMELLAEAGYRDRNGDGVLQGPDGEPFEFSLTYVQENTDTRRIVQQLRDQYARAGILMKPKPTEWSVMLESLDRRDFDAITLGWTSGIEVDIYQMFHSSQIESGDNFIGYRNEALDEVIDAARATVDEDERMQLWHEAERHLYEDQPYTFLMRKETLLLVDDRFEGLRQTRLGLNVDLLPLEWYVPVAEQKYR
ncbi:MAG: peptide-binding protein [Pseudomonadota bacterium]